MNLNPIQATQDKTCVVWFMQKLEIENDDWLKRGK